MPYEVQAYPCEHERGLWIAHIVDDEGKGPKGEGPTKIAALVDLGINAEDMHDHFQRFSAILAAILKAQIEEAETDGRNKSYILGLQHAMGTVEGVV